MNDSRTLPLPSGEGWGEGCGAVRATALEVAKSSVAPLIRSRRAGTTFPRRGKETRRGISLLEVLAAMLVLTIGILGMARLIPVGVYQLSQVYKLDGASTLGRASFRDLEVRGYLSPSRWYDPAVPGPLVSWSTGQQLVGYNWMPPLRPGDPTPQYPHSSSPPFSVTTPPSPPPFPSLPFPPAVVIDPLMVTSLGVTPSMVQSFPYAASNDTLNVGAPWIPRVNVMVPDAGGNPVPMSGVLADRIFRSSDEGLYSVDATDPVTSAKIDPAGVFVRQKSLFGYDQSYVSDPQYSTNPGQTKSKYRTQSTNLGSDSWFLTLIPTIAETGAPAGMYSTFTPQATARQFTASVVICNKRDLTLPLPGPSVNTPPPGERMLLATVQPGGVGGGDVLLTSPNAGLPDWVNVRPGQWIMLSCFVPQTASSQARLIADWYRVVGVGDPTTTPNPPPAVPITGATSRFVTLHGPDWPLKQVIYVGGAPTTLEAQIVALGIPAPPVYATIVDGVTGVYQKTITLDGSSSWQQ